MNFEWLELFRESAGAISASAPLVVTLATVDLDGSPRARTVVIRHVADDGSLWFLSDARSDKCAQLARRNEAEIVAWLPTPREQFRFFGTVDCLGAPATGGLRLQLWQQISNATRATFLWPAPGEPRAADAAFPATAEANIPIPDHFHALFLEPAQVERLRLGVTPHQRRRWREKDDWKGEDINP